MARDWAGEYERLYPGAAGSDAQAEERMQRLAHKAERREHRRTGRTRGIVVPRLPWKEGEAA